jgi:hypothetical protein
MAGGPVAVSRSRGEEQESAAAEAWGGVVEVDGSALVLVVVEIGCVTVVAGVPVVGVEIEVESPVVTLGDSTVSPPPQAETVISRTRTTGRRDDWRIGPPSARHRTT